MRLRRGGFGGRFFTNGVSPITTWERTEVGGDRLLETCWCDEGKVLPENNNNNNNVSAPTLGVRRSTNLVSDNVPEETAARGICCSPNDGCLRLVARARLKSASFLVKRWLDVDPHSLASRIFFVPLVFSGSSWVSGSAKALVLDTRQLCKMTKIIKPTLFLLGCDLRVLSSRSGQQIGRQGPRRPLSYLPVCPAL